MDTYEGIIEFKKDSNMW